MFLTVLSLEQEENNKKCYDPEEKLLDREVGENISAYQLLLTVSVKTCAAEKNVKS